MASKTATAPSPATTDAALPTAVLDKYKAAAGLVEKALKGLVPACKEGITVLELAKQGDKLIESEADKVYNKKGAEKVAKGLAYPTCVSVNNVLANFSPLPTDTVNGAVALKAGDVVKITVGAHIDGYASIAGETLVVGSESVDDPAKADIIQAAYQASEIALRAVKPGNKNWEVSNAIAKILDEYKGKDAKVRGVEVVSTTASAPGWRMQKDDIQAKKTITPFPTLEQRRDSDNTHTFEEGEVYSLTVAVTNGEDAKAKDSASHPTSIYCRLPTTYQLKMKASREVYSEIVKKAGAFPFPLRILENETRAKLAVRECVQHSLLKPFDVQVAAAETDLTASFTITFAVTKAGVTRLSLPPVWYSPEKVKSKVEITNDETKALLTKSLKAPKKKPAAGGEKKAEEKK